IVVIVAGRRAHAVASAFQVCMFSDIYECAVYSLMMKSIPKPRFGFVGRRVFRHRVLYRCAVSEKKIHATIVVVIKHRDPASHGLKQVLGGCRRPLMSEIDLRLRDDVCERHGRRPFWAGRGRGLWQILITVRAAETSRWSWSWLLSQRGCGEKQKRQH